MSKPISRRTAVTAGATTTAAVAASLGLSAGASASPLGAVSSPKDRSKEELFRYNNSALVFIDYQPEMLAGVHSMNTDLLKLNAKVLARFAVKAGIPVVLSTIGVKAGTNRPTVATLSEEIPNASVIDRSTMNAWDDPAFRKALQATGRKRFVMCGLWTEICLTFPVVDMQAQGIKTAFPADAVGGTTKEAHKLAIQRMVQVGSTPQTTFATMAEWVLDWATPQGAMLREVGAWYQAELAKLDAKS